MNNKNGDTVVLLSSGLDSTVNLYEAILDSNVILCLTFDYGQKSAKREIEHSQKICQELGLPHKVLDLSFFKFFTKSSLINPEAGIPQNILLDNKAATTKSALAVWVPNRNGIFLSIAAGFAEGMGAKFIVPGFNIEEAQTFPDNTQEFLNSVDASLKYSTSNQIATRCYTTHLNKKQIADRGKQLGIKFNLIWPCYGGGEEICRTCESCSRFLRATENIKEASPL